MFIFLSLFKPPYSEDDTVGDRDMEAFFETWWKAEGVLSEAGKACLAEPNAVPDPEATSSTMQQRKYKRVNMGTGEGKRQVARRDFGKLYRPNVIKAFLVHAKGPYDRGVIYRRKLHPDLAKLCLFEGKFPPGMEQEQTRLGVAKLFWIMVCACERIVYKQGLIKKKETDSTCPSTSSCLWAAFP